MDREVGTETMDATAGKPGVSGGVRLLSPAEIAKPHNG